MTDQPAPADRRASLDRADAEDGGGSANSRPSSLRTESRNCGCCDAGRFQHDAGSGRCYNFATCGCERYAAPHDGIPMVSVASSNIDAIGFEGSRHRLIVRFTSDSVYAYMNVPSAAYEAMLGIAREHGSVGSYLNYSVKGTYPYMKVPSE